MLGWLIEHRFRNDSSHIRLVEGEKLMKNFRPLHDRLLVKRVAAEEKSKGGIIIPDSAKEKPIEGDVIACGNGKHLDDGKIRPLEVKPGDRVLFGKYSGTEIKMEGEEHIILREDEVLGIIDGKKK
jgi:chaperonin GroES